MKPYIWINKYCNVYELKGDNTCHNKKSKRQENKNIIRDELNRYMNDINDNLLGTDFEDFSRMDIIDFLK